MPSISFEKQLLAVNPIDQIEHAVAQGQAVSGAELLRVIELSEGHQLDSRLRALLRRFSISASTRRGRPSMCRANEDFAMAFVDRWYPALLRRYQDARAKERRSAKAKGTILARALSSPSELAYKRLLEHMKSDFPNVDWRALRNKHSDWQSGRFHPLENDVDSEDFEAEIERQFPTSRRS